MGNIFCAKLKQFFENINLKSSCVSTCCVRDAEIDVEIHERKHKKKHHHKRNCDDIEKEKE